MRESSASGAVLSCAFMWVPGKGYPHVSIGRSVFGALVAAGNLLLSVQTATVVFFSNLVHLHLVLRSSFICSPLLLSIFSFYAKSYECDHVFYCWGW